MRASCGTDLSCSYRYYFSFSEAGMTMMHISLTSLENAAIWTCRSNSGKWLSNKSGLERSTPRMMQSARLDAVWPPLGRLFIVLMRFIQQVCQEKGGMKTYRFSMASVTASAVSVDIAMAWPIPSSH